jgi:A/G-specific adenine glycosylase
MNLSSGRNCAIDVPLELNSLLSPYYSLKCTILPMTHPASLALLEWYADNARDLPWRNTHDPYAIWVSEIMLQQTRVETVIPYYERWMERYPTVTDLAEASIDEVLRHWEGLGYYRRAHNLHRGAIQVVKQYGGQIPDTQKILKSMPGIGEYTAAAIAALAFNVDAIALDGNLRRVFARLLDLEIDPRQPEGKRRIRAWADNLLPTGQASAFNQGLMDLGAMVCLPRIPRCEDCPLSAWCLAYEHGTQPIRPVKKTKGPIPHYFAAAGVLQREGKVLIGRRPEDKLLGGLWEFPGGKQGQNESLEECLSRELEEELGVEVEVGVSLGKFVHAYTHFRITVQVFFADIISGEPKPLDHDELAWVRPSQFVQYPMGKIDRAIARQLAGELS